MGTTKNPQIIHLTQSWSEEEKKKFIQFFTTKKNNFVWSNYDMSGLDTNLIMHHLSISPSIKLVKQKLRKMHPHIALLVKVELKNLLKATFIQAIDYAN